MNDYTFPPIELLDSYSDNSMYLDLTARQKLADSVLSVLESFNLASKVECVSKTYSTVLNIYPNPGVKVDDIIARRIELQVQLGRPVEFQISDYRLQIAIKENKRPRVCLRDIIASSEFREHLSPVALAIGYDHFKSAYIIDLKDQFNILVTGITGAGKSVLLSNMILSILYKASPEEVKLVLMDFKKVEFLHFNGLPHMLCDAITSVNVGRAQIDWLLSETRVREEMFKSATINIDKYNKNATREIPRIVVIIDEFLEMLTEEEKNYVRFKKNTEMSVKDDPDAPEIIKKIYDITMKSSQTGISLILTTQDAIRNKWYATLPFIRAHASLVTVNKAEENTMKQRTGYRNLLGSGDLLFTKGAEDENGTHAQAALVSYEEIDRVIQYIKKHK